MGKAENHVEGYLYKRVKAAGGMCLKFISGITGVPDRVVILAGKTLFIETKAPGNKPEAIQIFRHKQMRSAGADVRVVDSRPMVDDIITELMRGDETREEDAA